MAKARVAPVKVVSVPKLELTALLLAARLCNYVLDSYKDELNVEDITIWSDSQVTLTWLKYERSFHVYIRNRIDKIYQLVPPCKTIFKYVPTKENLGDLLTRGVTLRSLRHNTLWWRGPDWLMN